MKENIMTMFSKKTGRALLTGVAAAAMGFALAGCGGGGSSPAPAPPVVVTPPPPPPPPVSQANSVTVEIASATNVPSDEMGNQLETGAHRGVTVGDTLKLTIKGEGKFNVSTSPVRAGDRDVDSCSVTTGDFTDEVTLEIKSPGSVECLDVVTIKNDTETLWEGTLGASAAQSALIGLDPMSISIPIWESSSATDVDPDGFCPEPAGRYNTYGLRSENASSTIIYTSESIRVDMVVDDNGNERYICSVQSLAVTNESSEERVKFWFPVLQTIVDPVTGSSFSEFNASSPIGHVDPTWVFKDVEFGNMSQVQYGLGTRPADTQSGTPAFVLPVGGQTTAGITPRQFAGSYSLGMYSSSNAAVLGVGLTIGQGAIGTRPIAWTRNEDGTTTLGTIGSAD